MYHSVSFWNSSENTGYGSGRTLDISGKLTVNNTEYKWNSPTFTPMQYDTEPITFTIYCKDNAREILSLYKTIDVYLRDAVTNKTIKKTLGVPIQQNNATFTDSKFFIPGGLPNDVYLHFEIHGYEKNVLSVYNWEYIICSCSVRALQNPTGENSWASWRLIPSTRPYISPPPARTYDQEIPYMDGKIDLSELGVDDITFDNRSGSLEFTLVNTQVSGYDDKKERIDDGNAFYRDIMRDGDPDIWDWDQTYTTLLNTVHGRMQKVVLEDDPGYYYLGRVTVESLNSEEHYTTFSLNYDFEPYKKARFSTTQAWLWDSIDFEANPDILGIKNIDLPAGETWTTKFTTLRGKIVPKITIEGLPSGYKVLVKITDKKSTRTIGLKNGTNVLSNEDIYDLDDLYFSGNDTISLKLTNDSYKNITFSVSYRLEGL